MCQACHAESVHVVHTRATCPATRTMHVAHCTLCSGVVSPSHLVPCLDILVMVAVYQILYAQHSSTENCQNVGEVVFK